MRRVGGAQVQRTLERGLNPLLSLLPLSLFTVALLADLGALMSGLDVFGDVAGGVLAAALLVGLVALTALFVDYTTAPVGSVAHRVRGLASACTTGMVVGFTLAWYLRGDGTGSGAVFLLELVAFLGGLGGYLLSRSRQQETGTAEPRSGVGWITTITQELEQAAPSYR
jgi:uncharacterized membrane protein